MPLILYSTITQLAYLIATRHYGDVHYVWCAPCPTPDRYGRINPASSHPLELYDRFAQDVENGEKHSALIDQNKIGLIKGAEARFRQGVVDLAQRDRIVEMVKAADHNEFSPLLLAIPYGAVKKIAVPAPISLAARATSEEYIITDLPRKKFDVLQLRGSKK